MNHHNPVSTLELRSELIGVRERLEGEKAAHAETLDALHNTKQLLEDERRRSTRQEAGMAQSMGVRVALIEELDKERQRSCDLRKQIERCHTVQFRTLGLRGEIKRKWSNLRGWLAALSILVIVGCSERECAGLGQHDFCADGLDVCEALETR